MIKENKLNVFDMIKFPSREKREEILKNAEIQNIRYSIVDDRKIFPYIEPKYSSLVCFNNYISSCLIQYIELYGYYSKDLPQYIPKSNSEIAVKKILFNQTAEILYFKICTSFELIGQVINEIFDLGIKNDAKDFIKQLIGKIKGKNQNIYNILEKINKDKTFKKAKEYRNSLTHNFSPFVPRAFTEIDKYGGILEKRKASVPTNEIIETLEQTILILKQFCIDTEKEIKEYLIINKII